MKFIMCSQQKKAEIQRKSKPYMFFVEDLDNVEDLNDVIRQLIDTDISNQMRRVNYSSLLANFRMEE